MTDVKMPKGAQFLCVLPGKSRRGKCEHVEPIEIPVPYVYYLVDYSKPADPETDDPDAEPEDEIEYETHKFMLLPNYQYFDNPQAVYRGSAQYYNGQLVMHVFEIIKKGGK